MEDQIFDKVIMELQALDYRGIISLSLFNEPLAGSNIIERIRRITNMLPYKVSTMCENHNVTCDIMYRDLHLLVETNNWMSDGCDRGRKVAELSIDDRRAPCASPFREIAIDVDGNFRMCCNMYVTTPAMANILQTSIADFYFSNEMNSIRKELITWGKKRNLCSSCNTFDYSMSIAEEEWEKCLHESGIYNYIYT